MLTKAHCRLRFVTLSPADYETAPANQYQIFNENPLSLDTSNLVNSPVDLLLIFVGIGIRRWIRSLKSIAFQLESGQATRSVRF